MSTSDVSPGRPVVFRKGLVLTLDDDHRVLRNADVFSDGTRIAAVGPNAAMAAFTAPSTRTIDLRGKTVIPGLIDSHAHMDREGLKTVFPSLGRVRSIRDIQNRIAELARQKAHGEWIVTMPIGDPPFYFDVPDILTEKRAATIFGQAFGADDPRKEGLVDEVLLDCVHRLLAA